MTYTRKLNPIDYNYAIDSINLTRTNLVKNLEVLSDHKLLFNGYIQLLGFIIRHTKCFSNPKVLKCLYFGFVKYPLEYACLVWYSYYSNQKRQLEQVQRKFAKYLWHQESLNLSSKFCLNSQVLANDLSA